MKKLIFILIILFNFKLIAQDETFWECLKGPPTGRPLEIAINSNDDVFVGSMNGIFRSTNHGELWEQVFNGKDVWSIAISKEDYIFAIHSEPQRSNGYRVLYSSNNGNSWAIVNEPWYKEPYEIHPWKIICDNDNKLYLLCSYYSTYIIYVSNDFGKSWNELSCPRKLKYGNLDSGDVFIKDIDVKDGKILCGGGYKYRDDANGIILISDNAGINWYCYVFPNIRNDFNFVFFVKILPDNELIASTVYDGYYNSYDEGITWNKCSPYYNLYVMDLFYLSKNERFISTYGGIYYTSDNGITWENRIKGFENFKHIYNFKIKGDSKGNIYTIMYQGIYRSTNKGNNWQQVNKGYTAAYINDMAFDKKGNIYATSHGVFRSSDKGYTWEMIGLENLWITSIAINNNGYIITGNTDDEGIYRSSNEGKSWENFREGLCGSVFCTNINSLVINKKGVIFAAVGFGQARSFDNGESWESIDSLLGETYKIGINSEGHIFSGGLHSVIRRSMDEGNTWSEVHSYEYILMKKVCGLFFHPYNSIGYAYGKGHYTFKTEDNGSTWNEVEDFGYSGGFALDSLRNILRVSNSSDILRSSDNGISWEKMDKSGLKQDNYNKIHYNMIAVSPDGYIYLAAEDAGLYRSRQPIVSVEEKPKENKLFLSQNYPNPFDNETKITFTLINPAYTRLIITDLLGINKEVLIDGWQSAGEHSISFKTDNYPSGIYFYRLEAGGEVITKTMVVVR